jgi:hypothetical protein
MKYYQIALQSQRKVTWASLVSFAVHTIWKAAGDGSRRRRRPIQLKLLPPALRVVQDIEQPTLGAARYYVSICSHIVVALL